MCEQKPGVDEVGRCAREWKVGDVVRLESNFRKASSGRGDEDVRRIDADKRLGATDLT
jgi:hypothetical protein